LAAGYWLLAFGFWPLAFGTRHLALAETAAFQLPNYRITQLPNLLIRVLSRRFAAKLGFDFSLL
jgi:hypothetical protein